MSRSTIARSWSSSSPAAANLPSWRIGTEHEKFGFRLDDLRPLTYDGAQGIEAVLRGLIRFGWAPFEENGKVIALTREERRRSRSNPRASWNFPAHRSPRSTTPAAKPPAISRK
jgi:gamma-glutamylcysteine synthetase